MYLNSSIRFSCVPNCGCRWPTWPVGYHTIRAAATGSAIYLDSGGPCYLSAAASEGCCALRSYQCLSRCCSNDRPSSQLRGFGNGGGSNYSDYSSEELARSRALAAVIQCPGNENSL